MVWFIAFGVLTALLSDPAFAVPLCKATSDDPAACSDKTIVTLDTTVGAAFDAAIARAADPLTATLLRQEDTRRALVAASIAEITDGDIPTTDFLRKSLLRDQALLNALKAPVPDGIAGDWLNAFADVHITPIAGGRYHLVLERTWVDNRREGPATGTCTIEADLAPAVTGWFAVDGKSDDPTAAKAIRQGPSLRLVLGAKSGGGQDCSQHDAITGSYFRAAAAVAGVRPTPVYSAEKPSFDCKGANGEIEMDICSDPDLALQDRELAAAYRGALGRVDAGTGKFLKVDQALWLKQRSGLYDDALLPTSAKSSLPSDDFGMGRSLLLKVTKARIAMLEAIEGQRTGFVGDWMSTDSYVRVSKTQSGALKLRGITIYLFYHGGDCDYTAAPKLVRGELVAPAHDEKEDDIDGRDTPSIWSDGRTMLIDSDLAAKTRDIETKSHNEKAYRAHYCERGRNPTARLFPIKAGLKHPFGIETGDFSLGDDEK